MRYVYYAEYLHYFERARSAFIRQSGISYAEIEQRNIFLPVREAHCRYRHAAHYDDLLYIHIGISEWSRASLRFVYEIRDERKERLLVEGMTQHALINREGKPVPVPDWFRKLCLEITPGLEVEP